MNQTDPTDTERTELLEYEQANEWWRQISRMRRQDLALFTAIQGGIITVIGDKLSSMDAKSFILSLMGFCAAAIWFNNERRLYSYLYGFRHRAIEIEKKHGMALIKIGQDEVKATKFLLPSRIGFSIYYALVVIGWVVIWILNA